MKTAKKGKFSFERFSRRMKWLFSNSGVLALGLEHFFAMLPATILVPLSINSSVGETVIDVSLVLLTSGIGTAVFVIVSRGVIPAYLGSSFAYIGVSIYLIQQGISGGATPEMAYTYVGWSYIFSGLLLMLLSVLYRIRGIEKALRFLLPASVIGPAVSLIGLELADQAVLEAGFGVSGSSPDMGKITVALVTLGAIVLFTLLKNKVWKNAAIIAGMVVGFLVYVALNGFSLDQYTTTEIFTLPKVRVPLFSIPDNLFGIFIAVIPATLIVFTENIGRVTVINRMVDTSESNVDFFTVGSLKKMRASLAAHGFATIIASFMGSVPNTIYAENIAVMGIHNSQEPKKESDPFVRALIDPFSVAPYLIAAGIAVALSFLGVLQTFVMNIPSEVIAGMKLFLFGIISAPGIQMLVEQRVNYKKVSNQIITAAVLISGCSGVVVDLKFMELQGMSLGFVVGVLLNLLVQIIKWFGSINDVISFDEVLLECLVPLSQKKTPLEILDIDTTLQISPLEETEYDSLFRYVALSDLKGALSGEKSHVIVNERKQQAEFIRDVIYHAQKVVIGADGKEIVVLEKTANSIFVKIRREVMDEEQLGAYINDFPDAIDAGEEYCHINVLQGISTKKVQRLLRSINV